jgi:protocatechuate 4,5-dioxygenase, alpha chain
MRNDMETPSLITPAGARYELPAACRCALSRGRVVEGTPIFDGERARRGYALNRLCFSLNQRENRDALLHDEDAYCRQYNLNNEQREAVRSRNVEALLRAGGNIYYLAKLAGCFGMNVQDIGAQQTGMSVEAFRAKLRAAGEA